MPPRVTVHTPTWNRAKTLPRAWESLRRQTYTDFEWLVTDDASQDGTLGLLESWQGQSGFDLRIRTFPRRVGKPVQDNDAARAARGEFILQLGSDDTLTPNALQSMVDGWESIPDEARGRFCSVTGRTALFDGTNVGHAFPSEPFDVSFMDLAYRLDLHYDYCVMVRADVQRRFPYPEVDYVVPESVVWIHALGNSMLTRCINDLVMVGSRDTPDSITGSGKMRYNRGYAYGMAQVINNPEVHLARKPAKALRTYLNYGRLSHHGRVPFRRAAGLLRSPARRAVLAAVYPLSRAVAARDRLQRKVEYTPFEPFAGAPRAIEPANRGAT